MALIWVSTPVQCRLPAAMWASPRTGAFDPRLPRQLIRLVLGGVADVGGVRCDGHR